MSKTFLAKDNYLSFINFLLLQKRALIEIGSRYGLTSMQSITLLTLDEARPMNYITHLLNCDASNVTGIIDGLQNKELAAREEDKSDRRIRMVELTSKGIKLRETVLRELLNDSNPIFSKLKADELKQFFLLIGKITN